jgi:hypothetical protein
MDANRAESPSRPGAAITAAAGELPALSLVEVAARLQLVLAVRRHARLAEESARNTCIAHAA